jgi:hypothetical protein
MLWKEHAVRVISPPRAGAPNIIGPEVLRKVSAGYGAADIFDEPAHEAKCGIDETGRSPSPAADRSAAIECVDVARDGLRAPDAAARLA